MRTPPSPGEDNLNGADPEVAMHMVHCIAQQEEQSVGAIRADRKATV